MVLQRVGSLDIDRRNPMFQISSSLHQFWELRNSMWPKIVSPQSPLTWDIVYTTVCHVLHCDKLRADVKQMYIGTTPWGIPKCNPSKSGSVIVARRRCSIWSTILLVWFAICIAAERQAYCESLCIVLILVVQKWWWLMSVGRLMSDRYTVTSLKSIFNALQ